MKYQNNRLHSSYKSTQNDKNVPHVVGGAPSTAVTSVTRLEVSTPTNNENDINIVDVSRPSSAAYPTTAIKTRADVIDSKSSTSASAEMLSYIDTVVSTAPQHHNIMSNGQRSIDEDEDSLAILSRGRSLQQTNPQCSKCHTAFFKLVHMI